MFKTRNSKGFSLIELLVVISIIGTLSSIFMGMLRGGRDQAEDAKIKSQLRQIRVSAENYYSENNGYGPDVWGTELPGTSIGEGCDSGMFSSSHLFPLTRASNYPSFVAGSGRCSAYEQTYAVSIRLNLPTEFWCIDSLGSNRQTVALHDNSSAVDYPACQ